MYPVSPAGRFAHGRVVPNMPSQPVKLGGGESGAEREGKEETMTLEEAKELKVGDLIRSKEYKYDILIIEVKERGIVGVLAIEKTHKHFSDWSHLAQYFEVVK